MRLYRGLTKDGKWVYGYYVVEGYKKPKPHFIVTSGGIWHEVIPETVGQQTGLKDRDKVDIYRGDIMEWYNGTVAKGQNPICRTVVKWNNLHSRYEGIVRTGRVIGNIHQNPELLERKQNE